MRCTLTDSRDNSIFLGCFLALGLVHAVLCGYQAYWNSATLNEKSHLVAGLSHLRFQRFDLFRVNPPLVRLIAAIPVMFASPEGDWSEYRLKPTERSEAAVGYRFAQVNGPRFFWLITLARWACLPFSLLGGGICGCWALRLFGLPSGILAMALWFFSPMILGHTSLLTADAHAAAMGAAAMYGIWQWLLQPNWKNSYWAGLLLGLAELCKTTLLVFYPVVVVLWTIYRFCDNKVAGGSPGNTPPFATALGHLAVLFVTSMLVINLGYAFEDSFKRLGDYRFQTELFTGRQIPEGDLGQVSYSSRFSKTWLSAVPVPLPANYVQGIDTQRLDFERKYGNSYLCGTWQDRGWWYWYLCAFCFKAPLGILGLLATAILAGCLGGGENALRRHELAVLLPGVAVFALVSSQDGFSIHYRYVLPALPFLFIWLSKSAAALLMGRRLVSMLVLFLATATVAESLSVCPHSLSFFNLAVGGPRQGHQYLLDSNIGWGQDLFYLDKWREEHPHARPLFLFDHHGMSQDELWDPPFEKPDHHTSDLRPGWYAVDVNVLQRESPPLNGIRRFLGEFLHFEPVAMAGYSIYIYHITLDDANRVRRKLGLPELSSPSGEHLPAGEAHSNGRHLQKLNRSTRNT